MWIYTRLSNDDDPERDSLQNQERICREFAAQRGDHIAGLSSDDNISGMNFSRRGLSRLTAAVEAGGLDGVVVKDCPAWDDTAPRPPCLSTTCGSGVSGCSPPRKGWTPSGRRMT